MKNFSRLGILAATLILLLISADSAVADKICIKPGLKKGKVTLARKVFTGAKCGKGYTEVGETASASIPAVYGDGSAGAYPGSVGLTGLFSSINITDVTVPSGITLRSTEIGRAHV